MFQTYNSRVCEWDEIVSARTFADFQDLTSADTLLGTVLSSKVELGIFLKSEETLSADSREICCCLSADAREIRSCLSVEEREATRVRLSNDTRELRSWLSVEARAVTAELLWLRALSVDTRTPGETTVLSHSVGLWDCESVGALSLDKVAGPPVAVALYSALLVRSDVNSAGSKWPWPVVCSFWDWLTKVLVVTVLLESDDGEETAESSSD